MANRISLTGRRLPDTDEFPREEMKPGDYLRYKGQWHATLPNGMFIRIPQPQWTVTENPGNNSITVHPSIQTLPAEDPNSWHGYLINGNFQSQ